MRHLTSLEILEKATEIAEYPTNEAFQQMMNYDPKYPSVDDLRERAGKRIPRFAFEYLDGECNEDVTLHRNMAE